MRTIIAILLFLSLGILPINAQIIMRGEVHSSDEVRWEFVSYLIPQLLFMACIAITCFFHLQNVHDAAYDKY